MQTILGANGVIGNELSRLLPQYTDKVRQVGRHPKKVNATDETFTADLLDPKAVSDAVEGSEMAYLVAGLKYDAGVWAVQWPKLMRNVIDACKRHGTKLVFFDNVYAYGRVEGVMKEDTPYNPCSKKGEVRARIATMLMDEVRRGELQALIVRSADFYGPHATMSFTHVSVFERLKAGKAPQWMGDPRAIHTFSYTPDAARSAAVLGNMASAYGQVWHALSSKEMISSEQFVRIACELAGKPFKLQPAPRWMLGLMGLFVPVLRESLEMLYQFEHDYRFDSSKLEQASGLTAIGYREGIKATLQA